MDEHTREKLEAVLGYCIATGKDQWETAQMLDRHFDIWTKVE